MIKIENISKSFGNKVILKNITLSLETGKVYGIVGENGAGKTTLFRCIAGLEKYEGNILSNFHPLKDVMGYLPTEPYFFEKMTGAEYLNLLRYARDLPAIEVTQQNIFDLPLNQYAGTYSTGMKKKLGLNGILLQKNEVFVLDEPFNGVDIQSNELIKEIILALKEKKKTILISSHIFSTLTEICDEIHLLKDGRFEVGGNKDYFKNIESTLLGDRLLNKITLLDL